MEQPQTGAARFAIVFENINGSVVVHVFGELDLETAPELDDAIVRARADGSEIIVNLTECRYLDSTTLTVLVRSAKSLGRRLRVVIPPKALIARVFAITQLDKVLDIVPSLEDAISVAVDFRPSA